MSTNKFTTMRNIISPENMDVLVHGGNILDRVHMAEVDGKINPIV